MQNLEDLREKLYFESKNIIETLSKVVSSEELLSKKDLIEELNERVSFLRILEKNGEFFTVPAVEESDEEVLQNDFFTEINSENEMEEEVLFTNELNEIHKGDFEEEKPVEVTFEIEKPEIEEEPIEEMEISEAAEAPTFSQEEALEISKEEFVQEETIDEEIKEVYESKRQIVEIEKPEATLVSEESLKSDQDFESENEESHQDKRFKLANIKGLKSVQSLFDDDPLETTEERKSIEISTPKESSLLKTNVPTDFMEAEKPKPQFRLDLNDKIAFSKTLFGGSQSDLNDAIRDLNSFKTLEEAKEYLSDLYYERNWKKADEYAQRLWTLVENKFL